MATQLESQACEAARTIGRRLAAAGGALVALVSLLQHAPIAIACARGAATLLALSFGTRLGVAAMERAMLCDRKLALKRETKS